MKMNTKYNMQDSLFVFIKDKKVPAKEKIRDLEEIIFFCNNAIKRIKDDLPEKEQPIQ